MDTLLGAGQTVRSESGNEYTVREFLGGGGQGEVYRVAGPGKEWALKWYFANSATEEQYHALENLIQKGSPNEKFLWPLELVSDPRMKGYGYIMPLREKKYKGLIDLMRRRIDPSFYALVTAGFQLADSYFQLHSKGWCYKDISFGNVFFDPQNGDILICDNDNVRINKQSASSGVVGTPRFMAPEIVREETLPSTDTDLFSLAVLLFYMFFISHPLEGKKESAIMLLDTAAEKKLYGTEPVFIFDPNNDTNRPDPSCHRNALIFWDIYPDFFKKLFTRAFTDGVKNPEHGRVRENEWRATLIRLRDSIVYCQNCKTENFYDSDMIKKSNSCALSCWNCKGSIMLPPRIKIGDFIIMLNYNTKIYQHHLDGISFDFSAPVAQITQHPKNPNLWGLRNSSNKNWVTIKPDGSKLEVLPAQNVSLVSGIKIDFGLVKGEIRI
jgi:eukaryotic-like serine/threonine-protein kinase